MTTSEHARHARAEIEAIAASLRLHELARLLEVGRRLLEAQDAQSEHKERVGSAEQHGGDLLFT